MTWKTNLLPESQVIRDKLGLADFSNVSTALCPVLDKRSHEFDAQHADTYKNAISWNRLIGIRGEAT